MWWLKEAWLEKSPRLPVKTAPQPFSRESVSEQGTDVRAIAGPHPGGRNRSHAPGAAGWFQVQPEPWKKAEAHAPAE